MSDPAGELPGLIAPFPPASWFEAYNNAIPNDADRAFTLFEDQARTRMRLEVLMLERDSRRADLGVLAGLIIALTVLGAAVYCASIGQAWVAGVMGGLDVVALAGIFIYGTE